MRPAPCAAHPLRTRSAALGRAPGCRSHTRCLSCCQSCPSSRTRRCARPLPSHFRPGRGRCKPGRRSTPSLHVPSLLRSVHPRDRCHRRAPLCAREGRRDVRAEPRGRSRVATFVCRGCRIGWHCPRLSWTIGTEGYAGHPTLRTARTAECLLLCRAATEAARARRASRRARGTNTSGGVSTRTACSSALATRGVPRLPIWPTPPSAFGACAGAPARALPDGAACRAAARQSVAAPPDG